MNPVYDGNGEALDPVTVSDDIEADAMGADDDEAEGGC